MVICSVPIGNFLDPPRSSPRGHLPDPVVAGPPAGLPGDQPTLPDPPPSSPGAHLISSSPVTPPVYRGINLPRTKPAIRPVDVLDPLAIRVPGPWIRPYRRGNAMVSHPWTPSREGERDAARECSPGRELPPPTARDRQGPRGGRRGPPAQDGGEKTARGQKSAKGDGWGVLRRQHRVQFPAPNGPRARARSLSVARPRGRRRPLRAPPRGRHDFRHRLAGLRVPVRELRAASRDVLLDAGPLGRRPPRDLRRPL